MSDNAYILDLEERIGEMERQLAEAKESDAKSIKAYVELVGIAFKYEKQLDECKAAGFITKNGDVRNVLGTLPITADGCVVGFPPGTGGLWYKNRDGHVVQCNPMRMAYDQASRQIVVWADGLIDTPVSACYSTSDAARNKETK